MKIIAQTMQRERELENTFSCSQATTLHNHESSPSQITTVSLPLVRKKLPIKTSIMI